MIRCSSATRLLYHIHFRMSTSFLSFLFSFLFFKKEKSASFRSGLKYIIECILRQVVFYHFPKNKNVNIKFDIFSCFYRFAVLHNTQPVLLCIFTFRQRSSKAATAASLSRSLFLFLCKLLYLFLE